MSYANHDQRAAEYLGLPYLAHGRSKAGLDCWGLVHLFYWREFGVILPSYTEDYASPVENDELYQLIEENLSVWVPTRHPVWGDAVRCWIRNPAQPAHIGVYVGGNLMLHARGAPGVCIERLDSRFWEKRVVGFYRHNQRCAVAGYE